MAITYFLGLCTLRTLPGACPAASRAMIVKQGINTTSAGRGELNGAYGGLGQIVGVVMPLVWSRLFGFFSTTTGPWRRVGKGGHFFVGSLVMLMAAGICKSIDAPALSLGDGGSKGKGRE